MDLDGPLSGPFDKFGSLDKIGPFARTVKVLLRPEVLQGERLKQSDQRIQFGFAHTQSIHRPGEKSNRAAKIVLTLLLYAPATGRAYRLSGSRRRAASAGRTPTVDTLATHSLTPTVDTLDATPTLHTTSIIVIKRTSPSSSEESGPSRVKFGAI